MSKELLGVFALGLMVIGEFCAIYSEVVTARLAHVGDGSWQAFVMPVLLMCFAGVCLLGAMWRSVISGSSPWSPSPPCYCWSLWWSGPCSMRPLGAAH